MQNVAQREMAERIKQKKTILSTINFTVSEFKKSRINESEILYNGKMYDIKSTSIVGNTVHLLVLNDTKEEKLVEGINKLTKNIHDKGKANLPIQLINLLMQTFIFDATNTHIFFPIIANKNFQAYHANLLFAFGNIPYPPPKLF